MAKPRDVGVFQLDNGLWGFRFTMNVGGRQVQKKRTADENGNKLKTKNQAIRARDNLMAIIRVERKKVKEIPRKTVEEVFEEYRKNGRADRAYRTIQKQDSLWDNHIKAKFGKRFVDDISVAEVVDYLTDLYYNQGKSFRYTESFLKMFYLIFGQAYSRDYLDIDIYRKLCLNKDTKIHMPKMKIEDDTEIVAFSHEELALLDEYFKGANSETAYMLGRYCGLRANETYGLKWDNVDFENNCIYIDRQMQYQDGLIKLVSVKTKNGVRTVYLCDKIKSFLQEKYIQSKENEKQFKRLQEQKRRIIMDIDGKNVYSTEMVNCLYNGHLQTVNSFKYPSREIKKKLGIDFKYHYLRHTYGTLMAELNTPQHLLCNQMGHGNIRVTQLYYIAFTQSGIETLRKNLNQL